MSLNENSHLSTLRLLPRKDNPLRKYLAALAISAMALAPLAASALTGTLTAKLNVEADCSVNSGTLDFGTLVSSPTSVQTSTPNTAINVYCPNSSAKISFSDSDNTGTGIFYLRSVSTGGWVPFYLSLTSTTTGWLTNSASSSVSLPTWANNAATSVPIYGSATIASGQAIATDYSDNVTVTVTSQ